MGSTPRTLVTVFAIGVAIAGCAQKRAQPTARSAAPTAAAPAPAAVDDPSPDRQKRPRFGEAAVYIDGKAVGVLRFAEMPPTMKGRVVELGDGYKKTRYYFHDYARALGLDVKKVKALHLYGGQRVVVLDQAEFQRIGDRMSFSFLQGDRGKTRVHFPPMKIHVNTTIDMLSNVAFYVDKEPPVLQDGELVMADGKKIEGKVPYAPEEQGSGTRVYVDGQLMGTVKRKKLTNDLIVPADDEKDSRFSLAGYASTLGVDTSKAKAVDLLAGDDVVARLEPGATKSVTFQVPARNRGQAVVDVPVDGGKQAARVSAVQFFVKSAPPARTLTKIDDAPEARPGTEPGGSGPSEDQ